MKRNLFAAVLIGLLFLPAWGDATAAPASRLISRSDAARHGLKRAWFTQARLDPGRSRINHIRLIEKTDRFPDTLFVQTDGAMVHAINAETGQTLWVRTVGNRADPTMALGASAEVVGIVNGSRLHLLDRSDGRIVWSRRVAGIPADGPVLTKQFVFVPMIDGQVLAYPLEKEGFDEEGGEGAAVDQLVVSRKPESETEEARSTELKPAIDEASEGPLTLESCSGPPLTCVSFGRVTSQPIFIHNGERNQYLAWSTNKGLFVGFVNLTMKEEFAVKYQLRTRLPMVTQPTYLPPGIGEGNNEGLIFSTSESGEVHAVAAIGGSEAWQYAIGQPVNEPVIPIRERVYVVSELGTLFCFESGTGHEYWSIRGVGQFVAASKDHVYVADRAGQIQVLDVQTGARVDSLLASDLPLKFRNMLTDRIYLASPSGLIQCLHETTQVEPLRHRTTDAGKDAPDTGPGSPAKPDGAIDPFAAPAAEEGKEEKDPFAVPAEGGGNPFE